MKSFYIFTWNPEIFEWDDYKSAVRRIFSWTTRSRQMSIGDAFIMIRTGKVFDPGIVGYGYVASEPYESVSWKGDLSWIVDLKFTGCIDTPEEEALISRNTLTEIFPTSNSHTWAPQSNGNHLRDEYAEKLYRLLFEGSEGSDSEEIDNNVDNAETGERTATAKQRIGQNVLREKLLNDVGRCELSGISNPSFIRVSHIKPWRIDVENRGNLANALLLAVPYDFLFDKGFISFDKNGKILISSQLSLDERRVFALNEEMKLIIRESRFKEVNSFLNWHRKHLFQA